MIKQKQNKEGITHNGRPFVNIGTENACLFLNMSKQLINILKRNELLYFAIEEALRCAVSGYYSAGILAYSQCLNCFNGVTPNARHKVAHEFLQHKPSKEEYDSILEQLKYVAEAAYAREVDKVDDREQFHRDILFEWGEYARDLVLKDIKNENQTKTK